MSKRAILHIPHSDMLNKRTIEYWIDKFSDSCRVSPTEVVLPGVGFLGPNFDSKVYRYPGYLKPGNLLPDWIRLIHKILGNETVVWASIVPGYKFLGVETVMIMDQYGHRFDQACITNPTVQKITDTFVEEMSESGLAGFAFDLTDIYPNSGSNTLKGIQNSCFCSFCAKQLELEGWQHGQRTFVGTDSNNISRFVLRLTETGADHIEARYEWIRDNDAMTLVQFAEARGFVADEDEAKSIEDAELLLKYLAIRGKVTAKSMRILGNAAREKGMLVSAILGDQYFDMTQCTDLASLIQQDAADQYWLPLIDSEFVEAHGVNAVQYFFSRGTYLVNSFFETVSDADVSIGFGVDSFITRLLRTSAMTRSNKLNPGAVLTVEFSDEYTGFVGIPLDQRDVVHFVEGLTKGTLGQVVPRHVIDQIIEQVRLSSPPTP